MVKMSLQKTNSDALAIVEFKSNVKSKPAPKVLDEDAYTEDLEHIIQRDFFPDLKRMKAQSEWLEALERNDHEKLRLLHIKYGPKRPTTATPSIYSTPATFETPEHRPGQEKPTSSQAEQSGEDVTGNPEPVLKKEKQPQDHSLDSYLAKNTSEDNASFNDMMVENEKKHRQKHAWLYENEVSLEQDEKERQMLPSIEKQAIEGGSSKIEGWKYTMRNSLMYVPDGAEESAKELVMYKTKPREIVHKNTHFEATPFNLSKSKETIAMAASVQAKTQHGRIGPDGKEVMPTQSPKVNGYGFCATPSPAPGVNESPLMTWGEIEGTPFRLDGGDTPASSTPGPNFRIPDIPKRDQIGMKLAEKASKAHRAKKKEALKRATASLVSPSPKFGSVSSQERLSSMSPAAQRLASTKLGVRKSTDKALRASYTPSPTHRLPGDKTPTIITPTRTPSSSAGTPRSTGSGTPKLSTTPKRQITESLTDNLLNIPKRSKATDYF